jgi:DNA-binding response OmpR family regulator
LQYQLQTKRIIFDEKSPISMNVLVIEDEPKTSASIKDELEKIGYNVQVAFDGETAIRLASTNKFDIILTDVVMPGINGFEIVKKLRNDYNILSPIIIVSALNQSKDIIEGLDIGADDYITKPFEIEVLLARMRAVLRRKKNYKITTQNILKVSDIKMNLDTKIVTRSGKEINLTAKEFTLLKFFMINKNIVLDRVQILENVWDINFDAGTNVVDVYVNYLRKKIDKNFDIKLIQTVVGMGYSLREI